MNSAELLEQLSVIDPVCNQIGQSLQLIEESYQQNQLSADERSHLIQEIRDIRAAQECAGNEIAFRAVVQACNLLLSVV